MALHLRDQFERAAGDDPGADTGEMARAAIVAGAGLRRKRRLLTGAVGAAAAIGVLGGTYQMLQPPAAQPEITVAAAMMPRTSPSCEPQPVEQNATDVLIFLGRESTDGQRSAIAAALGDDPAVGRLVFENRQQAFERFQTRWRDHPGLVAEVSTHRLPESFRLRLTAPAEFAALRSRYATMAGVDQISGRRCTADAPIGGVL
jgi:hypothetical protein